MWSNVISVDKRLDRELDYIIEGLSGVRDLSYAVEENEKRIWIYLASTCDQQDRIETEMYAMLEDVFLSFLKLRFFLESLKISELGYANCALLSSMLHFDRAFERNAIAKMLSSTLDYNVDGLYNFRMRSLKEAWQEVADVAARLLDGASSEQDIFDISGFISGSEGRKSKLELDGNVLKNISERKIVRALRLYDNSELNLLDAIIREKPSELSIKGVSLSSKMLSTLRKITRVIEKQ